MGQSLGHFLDVILELEAETLSELIFFNARSDYIGFRSWFYQNGGVFGRGRVEFSQSSNLGQSLGHFLDVILELEAGTLSESRFFYARSDHLGFRS